LLQTTAACNRTIRRSFTRTKFKRSGSVSDICGQGLLHCSDKVPTKVIPREFINISDLIGSSTQVRSTITMLSNQVTWHSTLHERAYMAGWYLTMGTGRASSLSQRGNAQRTLYQYGDGVREILSFSHQTNFFKCQMFPRGQISGNRRIPKSNKVTVLQ